MKYYKLEQDRRIPNSVLLADLSGAGGYYNSKGTDLSGLGRAIVSSVISSTRNFYPDILDRHIFMVKGAVKEVFDLFLPELDYKHCCLLDKPNDRYDMYYIPMLDVVDMQEGAAQGRHVFRIAKKNEIMFVASLEVVEAVLRRKPAGIRISSISE